MANMQVMGLEEAQRRLALAAGVIVRTATQVFTRRLQEARDYGRSTFLTGGTTPTRLAERSGGLKQSFDFTVQTTSNAVVVGRLGFITHPPSWAGVHEYGATIHPRTAQALAIPLTDEARQAGSPRNFPGQTFLARSSAGKPIIFARSPGGEMTPEYVLVGSVTIPARPTLTPTVERYKPIILEDLRREVGKALQGGTP